MKDDLISRQAAIDVEGLDEQIRCEMCRNPMHTNRGCDGNCKYDEKLYERIMQILGERIKHVPSAQPERTCVNCGRTANNGGWYADGGTRCPIEEHYALPKDGYCHLWEKRNVTDDDYPERRTDD